MFHMFQVIYAHEWMNDAHDHEMQVQLGKTNTRGVTLAIRGSSTSILGSNRHGSSVVMTPGGATLHIT